MAAHDLNLADVKRYNHRVDHVENGFCGRLTEEPLFDITFEFDGRTMGFTQWTIFAREMSDQRHSIGFGKEPPPMENRCPGYVYMLWSQSTNMWKIGISRHPTKRLAEVKAASGLADLEIVCQKWVPDCRTMESFLHQVFAPRRITGEWFRLTYADNSWMCQLPYREQSPEDALPEAV